MRKKLFLILLLSLFVTLSSKSQTIRFVKDGGLGNGTSWQNASGDLQAMIEESKEGDEVWVAAGMYKPNRRGDNAKVITLNDRFNAFVLRKNVAIYGGFAGNEATKSNRDFTINTSILSGDIGAAGTSTDNAYHVLIACGDLGTKATLDGFIVENGETEAISGTGNSISVNGVSVPSTRAPGMAIFSARSVTFRNLIVRNNRNVATDQHSGGAYVLSSTVDFYDVKFVNNSVAGPTHGGAGVMLHAGSSTQTYVRFVRTEFEENSASNGGALASFNYTNVILEDCIFRNNTATTVTNNQTGGGAIACLSSDNSYSITNSQFIGNKALCGGAIGNRAQRNPIVINGSSFSNNTVTQYGGAIAMALAIDGSLKVSNSTFTGNKTTTGNGGAISFDATVNTTTSNLTIENSTFTSNSAGLINTTTSSGGAVCVVNAKHIEIFGNTFGANVCGLNGGAIRLQNVANQSNVNNNVFESNSAGTRGGAVSVEIPNISFDKNRFLSNNGGNGGALYINATQLGVAGPVLTNSLFALNIGNGAQGGGGFLATGSSNISIYNCTFYNNTGTKGGTGYFYSAATGNLVNIISSVNVAAANLEFERQSATNVFSFNNSLTTIYVPLAGSNNLLYNNAQPLFASTTTAAANFLELAANSQVIDRGDKTLLPAETYYDLGGKPRVHNGIVDLGALEYGAAAAVGATMLAVEENVPAGQVVGKPIFTLAGTSLQYDILSGDVDTFILNANGEFVVRNNDSIDYETTQQYVFTVKISNGLDEQIVKVIIDVINKIDKPSKPVVANINSKNIVSTYRPTLSGSADINAEITIYVDGVAHPEKVITNANGGWTYTFNSDLKAGERTFSVTSFLTDLGVSEMSELTTATLKLYEGNKSIKPNNVLTPNGDGKNDVWLIENLTDLYTRNEVIVFDKAGKIVFQRKNYNNNWDGTSNGQVLNAGTYYYLIITATDMDPIKGTLTILR